MQINKQVVQLNEYTLKLTQAELETILNGLAKVLLGHAATKPSPELLDYIKEIHTQLRPFVYGDER